MKYVKPRCSLPCWGPVHTPTPKPLGHKELLGLWLSQNEGAKFWLSVLTELQTRGVKDILIACVDGLKGFPEAIEAVYPDTRISCASFIRCVAR